MVASLNFLSQSKQDVLNIITWPSKNVQWTETMLSKLATFPNIFIESEPERMLQFPIFMLTFVQNLQISQLAGHLFVNGVCTICTNVHSRSIFYMSRWLHSAYQNVNPIDVTFYYTLSHRNWKMVVYRNVIVFILRTEPVSVYTFECQDKRFSINFCNHCFRCQVTRTKLSAD